MSKFESPPSRMDHATFVATFGGIYEHSDWVAEAAWQVGISEEHDAIAALADLMASCVAGASDGLKSDLILAHPDLAGKAAVKGELTESSTSEQAAAGLDQCNADEFARFQEMNAAYKVKFHFPFIMAVRNSDRHQILAGFERRLKNDAAAEFAAALHEIDKIALFRLAALEEK